MCLCVRVCVGLTVVTMKCLVARRRRRLAAVHLTGSSILAGLHITAGATQQPQRNSNVLMRASLTWVVLLLSGVMSSNAGWMTVFYILRTQPNTQCLRLSENVRLRQVRQWVFFYVIIAFERTAVMISQILQCVPKNQWHSINKAAIKSGFRDKVLCAFKVT